MSTKVPLDEGLLEEAMRYTTAKSEEALVEEALRTFVKVKEAEDRRARYRERLQELEPRLQGLRLSESPAKLLRADRDR